MYSNIRLRAGLVALVFALISISFVSAVPIPVPASQSGLSSTLSSRSTPSHDGQNHIQPDASRIAKFSVHGQMSRAPGAARALTGEHNSINMDDHQLVRRSIGSKIKKAFQNLGRKIKAGFQKAGQKIKSAFQKVGQKIKSGFQKVGAGIKKVAQKIKSGFQKAGAGIKKVAQKIKSGFQTAGKKIKAGFQKAGAAIKKVAQKVGAGIKKAAQKVGHWVKTTGAKIVKFGLKVVQTVGKAIGKVVSFIPEIGKPLERAIDGVSKVAGVISDKIHVKLPGKLQKAVNGMNKADKIMDYIPRRRDLSEQEDFQQRDISDAYYFEELDDISLEEYDYEYYLDLE